MGAIVTYLGNLWWAIGNALVCRAELFQAVDVGTESFPVTFGVAFVGGASLLLGQSFVLFANRVKPVGFLLSLGLNGLIYSCGLILWAVAVWVVGSWWLAENPSLRNSTQLIFLSAAPMAFGFLALIPFFGTGILRLLSVWSFLIAVRVVEFEYSATFLDALAVVAGGWLVVLLVNHTVGRPVLALRDAIWTYLLGRPPSTKVDEVLGKIMADAGLSETRTSSKGT